MGFLKKRKEKKKNKVFLPCSVFTKAGSADSSVMVIYLSKCCLSDKSPGRAAKASISPLNFWPWWTSWTIIVPDACEKCRVNMSCGVICSGEEHTHFTVNMPLSACHLTGMCPDIWHHVHLACAPVLCWVHMQFDASRPVSWGQDLVWMVIPSYRHAVMCAWWRQAEGWQGQHQQRAHCHGSEISPLAPSLKDLGKKTVGDQATGWLFGPANLVHEYDR